MPDLPDGFMSASWDLLKVTDIVWTSGKQNNKPFAFGPTP